VVRLSDGEGDARRHAKEADLDGLEAHLVPIQPGQIIDTSDLERLFAACWDQFSGDYGGMEGDRLLGRMEDVTWEPPVRHTGRRHPTRDDWCGVSPSRKASGGR
jgi:hypothetical protein